MIDILVLLNDDITVVIEDKIDAPLHGRQLECYLEHAKNYSSRKVIVPIYLKTGTLGRNERRVVKRAGYAIFGKNDLRKVLDYGIKSGVDNDIYTDFRDRLRRGWRRGFFD
jgi:hypothetical protein